MSKYKGYDLNGTKITVVTDDEPNTMKIIQKDGTFKEVPYERRRTGELAPVPQTDSESDGYIFNSNVLTSRTLGNTQDKESI